MVSQISRKNIVKSNFDYIKNVYEVCLNRYLQHPKNVGDALNSIKHGRKILHSEEEVDTYISFYGAHHYYKLVEAFDAINLSRFRDSDIETISYGCGAATDTCSLISYCYANQINLSLKNITLIEPSSIALERGAKYIKESLPYDSLNTLQINKVCKLIDKLEENDVFSMPETIKIHVFSNILDIQSINLKYLASLIQKTQTGINYFICINPKNQESKIRIDEFYNYLSRGFQLSDIDINEQNITGKEIWRMTRQQYSNTSPIYRYHRIFKADSL